MNRSVTDIVRFRSRLSQPAARERFHVVIVGGGFSGIALAARLVQCGDSRLRITLTETGDRFGRGVAYATETDAHLLNTRAKDMSVFTDEPYDFVWWLERNGRTNAEGDFVTRQCYGDYIEDTLVETSLRAAEAGMRFTALAQVAVTDIMRHTARYLVSLDDGRTIECDAVILATGHPPSRDVLRPWLPDGHDRWVRDPWDEARIAEIALTDRLLIIGSGLTMVDKVLELCDRGHRGPIQILSRRGLIPRAHRRRPEDLPVDLRREMYAQLAGGGNLRAVLRTVRRTISAAERRGLTWHSVIDALRPITRELWSGMSFADRRRFLRWLRPYWDVHRHRMPPTAAVTIGAMLKRGRLQVLAGEVCGAEPLNEGIIVGQRVRGRRLVQREQYDWVVNCAGHDFGQPGRALEQRLIERGMLVTDPLGIGYATEASGAALTADDSAGGFYVLGPACRPRCWENTAVPELRKQADLLATELIRISGRRHSAATDGLSRFTASYSHGLRRFI